MKNGQADLDSLSTYVMKIDKSSTRIMLKDLITQAEMEARAKESLDSIEKGEVHSLSEFKQMNKEWFKKNSLK